MLVRELRQSPQLAGRVSFPSETSSGFRPYVKGSVIREERLDDEDEDAIDDTDALLPDDEDVGADALDYSEDISES